MNLEVLSLLLQISFLSKDILGKQEPVEDIDLQISYETCFLFRLNLTWNLPLLRKMFLLLMRVYGNIPVVKLETQLLHRALHQHLKQGHLCYSIFARKLAYISSSLL